MGLPLSLLVVIGLPLLGAIAGSYLATILLRWPAGRSAATARSECDHCQRPLTPIDLIPIMSYTMVRGRCRSCGGRIDPRHSAMELAAAGIGLVAALAHDWPAALATATLGWWLLILAALDAEHQWLPDRLTFSLWAAGWAIALFDIGPSFNDRLIGSAIGFGGLFLVGAVYKILRGRQGLGGGDPKLLGALGAWLGWQSLPFLILVAALFGLIAVALGYMRGEDVNRYTRLPFGTYLALAGWLLWLLPA